MPLFFKKGDITKLRIDAIVNAANNSLLGGGGVDGCIHRAAGPGLLRECEGLGGCATGDAKITKGYNLPADYVIHTVGPVWCGGNHNERKLLVSCYKKSLKLAIENNCHSVAFPLISAGAYGYPKQEAISVAVESINNFLYEFGNDLTVYIVFYDNSNLVSQRRVDCLSNSHSDLIDSIESYMLQITRLKEAYSVYSNKAVSNKAPEKTKLANVFGYASLLSEECSLDDYIDKKDECFSEKLIKFIEASGLTNSKCYNLANVSKQVFSKIISDETYTPKKPVALAFAIALKLSISETDDLLKSAGLALSRSNRFDLIIQYFLENKEYDIFKINEILMEYGEPQLGSAVK